MQILPSLDVWSVGMILCELIGFEPILKRTWMKHAKNANSNNGGMVGYSFFKWLGSIGGCLDFTTGMSDSHQEFRDFISGSLLPMEARSRRMLAECLSFPQFTQIPDLRWENCEMGITLKHKPLAQDVAVKAPLPSPLLQDLVVKTPLPSPRKLSPAAPPAQAQQAETSQADEEVLPYDVEASWVEAEAVKCSAGIREHTDDPVMCEKETTDDPSMWDREGTDDPVMWESHSLPPRY